MFKNNFYKIFVAKKVKDQDLSDNDLDSIKDCMSSKKVLVVVDDVGTIENLIALQVLAIKDKQNGISMSSNVIMTCRDWQILEGHVNENGKVDVAPLNMGQERKRLLFQAFRITQVVKEDFNIVIDEIVEACDGFPLSLEVMVDFYTPNDIWRLKNNWKFGRMSCKYFITHRFWMGVRMISFGGACKFLTKICKVLNAICFWILHVIFVVSKNTILFKYGILNYPPCLACKT